MFSLRDVSPSWLNSTDELAALETEKPNATLHPGGDGFT